MELFERVRRIATIVAGSQTSLAARLGMAQSRFQGYLNAKRQDNLWPVLPQILEAYPEIAREWLYFGEGEMLVSDRPAPPDTQLRAVPMVGLASCGIQGWNQVMPVAVSASLPVVGPNTIAVIAFGESMVPAGISSGQVCYADPDQDPLPGDAVYIARKDGLASVKLYLGVGERAGDVRLKGWGDPKDGERTPFYLDIGRDGIATLAPVIYVRRRL
ncbi:S24 family peptidase [Desulfovibrio oxamicus]|uniref:S24 family peptidase n=1 Tax=Nitratidesulfovibrio oxamicus TaxID=32016 RepID=A0ABS0J032_9BACT|nr:S24 family peptidase [Nitratidesulfovibrio oxamicus]MBG3875570.1 S24 family peptidase [Nitratidesulfovibrio oxamicus]